MNVSFSKSGIIWCIIIIFACIFIGKGFVAQCRYYDSYDFKELVSSDWEYGDYVSGNITSFVKNKIGRDSYRSYSGNYDGYYEYTVPASDNRYVRLRLNNINTCKQLEEACELESFSIPFDGVISSDNYSINYTFYENAGGIEPEQIITEYVITQIAPNKLDHSLIYGFIALLACLAIRLTGLLPPILTVEEAIAIPARTRYGNSCDCETEIEVQQRIITKLEARMEKLHKECRQSFILLPFGIIPFVLLIVSSQLPINVYVLVIWLIYYALSIMGLFVLLFALSGIFSYYIQTEGKLGIFLRTFKNITPIPKQIEICKDNLKYLEERLVYENSLTTIYSDKLYSELNMNQHKHITNEDWKEAFPPNEENFILLPKEDSDDIAQ